MDNYEFLPPAIQSIGHWLLLLEDPGEAMSFDPVVMGVKAESIQAYVYKINRSGERKYAVRAGVKREGSRHPQRMGKRKFRGDEPLLVFLRATTDSKKGTPPELAKAQRLDAIRERAGKMPAWKIAEELGMSTSNLLLTAAKNKISINYYRVLWTEAHERELLNLVAQGMSSAELGKIYGVTGGAIEMQLIKMRKRGVPVPARMRGGHRR